MAHGVVPVETVDTVVSASPEAVIAPAGPLSNTRLSFLTLRVLDGCHQALRQIACEAEVNAPAIGWRRGLDRVLTRTISYFVHFHLRFVLHWCCFLFLFAARWSSMEDLVRRFCVWRDFQEGRPRCFFHVWQNCLLRVAQSESEEGFGETKKTQGVRYPLGRNVAIRALRGGPAQVSGIGNQLRISRRHGFSQLRPIPWEFETDAVVHRGPTNRRSWRSPITYAATSIDSGRADRTRRRPDGPLPS